MNLTIDHKTHKKYIFIAISIFIAFVFVLSSSYPLSQLILAPNKSLKFVMTFSFAYIHIFMNFYTFQFIVVNSAIWLRFKALNSKFKTKFPRQNVKIVAAKNFDLVQASNYFHNLCDGIEIINNTFTFHAVFIFMQLMVS